MVSLRRGNHGCRPVGYLSKAGTHVGRAHVNYEADDAN